MVQVTTGYDMAHLDNDIVQFARHTVIVYGRCGDHDTLPRKGSRHSHMTIAMVDWHMDLT